MLLYTHGCVNISSRLLSVPLDIAPEGIARSHGSSIFSFWRHLRTVVHNGCTILRFQQWCSRVPVSLHPCQHFFSSFFFNSCHPNGCECASLLTFLLFPLSLAWEGRIVVVGFAGGTIASVPANLLLLKNISAMGLYYGQYKNQNFPVFSKSMSSALQYCQQGRIQPYIGAVFKLEEVRCP